MNKVSLGILVSLLFVGSVLSQQQNVIFSDDFESYLNGANGSPVWHVTKGFWQVEDGVYFQKSKEYDCGALLDMYLDTSFEMQVDFKVIEGEPGAGFFFHSMDDASTAFSHMSRFESDQTMLVGYFMQGGYEATRSVRFEKEKFLNKWHRLKMRIDLDMGHYAIFLDDEPIASEPLVFRAGFCGLQSSGGKIKFDNFTLTKYRTTGRKVALNWLHHIAVNKKNEIVAPNPARGAVQLLNWQGNPIGQFGAPLNEKGQLDEPVSVTQLKNGDYAVCDRGLHRIHIFEENGEWKNSIGYKGKGAGQFDTPLDVCVDQQDNIYVADSKNNRVQIFDKKLHHRKIFGEDRLSNPSGIALRKDKIYVLNNGLNRVEIYAVKNGNYIWHSGFNYDAGQGRDILACDDKIYVAVGNVIRLFDSAGNEKKEFEAASIHGFLPHGLALDKSGHVLISDFKNSRLVIVDSDLSDPSPIVSFPNNRSATIRLFTAEKEKATIRVKKERLVVHEETSPLEFKHQFSLKNLLPSTTYHFQFSPTVRTIPKGDGFSKKYAFITPPEQGKKHFWRLPIATIIFTNVIDTATVETHWPEMPDLPNVELIRIKSQILDGIRFYWVNSGMNLFLDNEFIIVEEKLYRHEIFGTEWWYPPLEKRVEKSIKHAGKQIEDYVGVLYLACVRDYNEKIGEFELRGRGGGFTAGYGANNQYGISYWEATRANHNSGNNWLMVHEFHHQLDELFMHSGYPEYWFCHFSPTINTADDFGEHFDGNAWILRNWPVANWYDLNFGDLQVAQDSDMDGIPDDMPQLPLNEKRLQSSPRFADSDGDGASDLEEVISTNWIVEGCGENYGGSALFPNLLNPDTDGDGILDNDDPYPLYPFEPKIHFSHFDLIDDSTGELRSELSFARLMDNRIHSNVFARWDSTNLYFAFEIDRIAPIKLMIDADANGWFIGRDNYLITLEPKKDLTLKSTVQINNCSDPQKWPFHDEQLASTVELKTTLEKQSENYLIRLTIPKNNNLGLNLQLAEKIGINIAYSVLMDSYGHNKYITIFEPNRFFVVDLVKRQEFETD